MNPWVRSVCPSVIILIITTYQRSNVGTVVVANLDQATVRGGVYLFSNSLTQSTHSISHNSHPCHFLVFPTRNITTRTQVRVVSFSEDNQEPPPPALDTKQHST